MTRRILLSSALLLVACGDDSAGDTDGATDTDGFGTGGSMSEGPGSGPTGQDSEPGDDSTGQPQPTSGGDESTSGQPPLDPADPAGGIRVTNVEVNQGVGILVGSDGAPLTANQRVAPIIGGRDALVRVDYSLDPSFTNREIEARVFLGSTAYVDQRSITGPSDWSSLEGTFVVRVDGADIQGDTALRVALVEPGGAATVGTDVGSAFPADEALDLEAWDDPMVLDVMLVPMTCDGYPSLDITPEKLANFEAFLFNTYPVQELNLTVHDPVHSPSCNEFDAAEYDLPAVRDADGAAPWVYYGGLLPGDGGGYSIAIQGGDQMDYRRTFANHAWRDEGLTSDLFAHELGHNHGREHAFEDPSFPAETGAWCGPRASYGWGPRASLMPTSGFSNDVSIGLPWFDPSVNLLAPTDKSCDGLADGNRYNYNDFMSYTYPFWVSAYTYAAAAERIRLISSWRGKAYAPPQGETARLVIGPEGDVHRVMLRGQRPVVDAEPAWAICGDQTVPVRVTHSTLERPGRSGPPQSYAFVGYELPLRDDLDVRECVLDLDGMRVPFVD